MMTREEAIEYAESKKMRLEALVYNDDCKYGNYAMYSGELSFVNAALSAIRPVSREQVEKVWAGCRSCKSCRSCVFSINNLKDMPCKKCDTNAECVLTEYKPSNFCPVCGKPLTDEAVEMVMERLEALHGET